LPFHEGFGLLMAGSQQIGWAAIRKNWTFVRGTELRPEVQKAYGLIISKPLATKLIEDAAGDPALIWTDASIASNKNLLCISYLVMAPLIAGCMLAASQVTICLTRQRSPEKHAKSGKKKPPVQ
jgi:hypothetical protein